MTENWIEEAKEAIIASSKTSSVYVGADSQTYKKHGKTYARYSTVIVLHVNSRNGCKIFHNTITLPDYGNLKQRLMNEASFAIEAASELVEILDGRPMDVHLDINQDRARKSNVAMKEAMGWVQGALGITPKVKPSAWAASYAADHAVRKLN